MQYFLLNINGRHKKPIKTLKRHEKDNKSNQTKTPNENNQGSGQGDSLGSIYQHDMIFADRKM